MSDAFNLYEATYMQDADFITPLDKKSVIILLQFLEDAETPLYQGCTKYKKLPAIVVLYRLKAVNGWSDKSFNGLLEILHDMLPIDNVLLKSVYSVRKFLNTFDLGCEKIHTCINDYCLFSKEIENEDKCPICGSSRWQEDERTKKIRKGVPAKVLRYFPIMRRFRRMFRSPKLAENLRWHFSNKSEDGHMRHPVDSLAWDYINDKWPDFASDPRNL
ncbi:hypothetical protein Dsin_000592 [Dipteronia sinensis]|uniref:Transposase n=1 Tax=Dipteronia sinensis TaxID=43782 RepID=A0AAE0EHN5_9ROSI|nr:hypothetical protein Dsin_000592 [Dipteronia sinensis]